jgi:hypothetical protein
MTEDDTFLKLKKVPALQLEYIIDELSEEEFKKLTIDESVKKEFLNRYGWTFEELVEYSNEKYAR